MIGAEICSVLGKQATNDALSLTICGNKELSSRYTRALNIFGIDQVRELQGTAPRGIWAVASAQGLLQTPSV